MILSRLSPRVYRVLWRVVVYVFVVRAANLVMSLLFLFSAALQLNDPDPARWVAIYGSAAVVCGWMAVAPLLRPAHGVAPLAVAAVALTWAGAIAWRASGHADLLTLFDAWDMKDTVVEETREMYGLLIVGVWMCVSVLAARSRPK
jgi:hypothetical protein